MKRFISKSPLFVIALALLTFTACEKESKTCTELQIEVSDASEVYYADTNNSVNCEAYKQALEAYIAAGCPDSGGFQNALNGLPCRF